MMLTRLDDLHGSIWIINVHISGLRAPDFRTACWPGSHLLLDNQICLLKVEASPSWAKYLATSREVQKGGGGGHMTLVRAG